MAEDAVAPKIRRRCTGADGDMSVLPDHVLREVLSRVGTVKDLFMLAATCRRWLGRFTDRTFLCEILCPSHGQGEGLLGFFLHNASQGVRMERCWKDARQAQLASACSFVTAPGSPLGPGPTAGALTSSLVADGNGVFDYAVPLAARRGIVLMERVPLPRRRDTHVLFGVCNPVTDERHLLAPLRRGLSDNRGYAIITAADADADADGRFTFLQLLVATMDSNWAVHLHLYSAATRSWSGPTLCLADGRCFYLVGQRSAVVHQGAAHWLWMYDTRGPGARDDDSLYKLSVQLGGGASATTKPIRFAFTRIPVRFGGNPLLCVTGDGKLVVVCVYISHVAVSTCLQQQQAGSHAAAEANLAWERIAFTIPAAVPYPDMPPFWQPKEKWFDLSRQGSMLVLYRSSAVFIVDLHRKTMEKVMDCFLPLLADKMNVTVVPYEMDLVDFFMLKLGGLNSARSSG